MYVSVNDHLLLYSLSLCCMSAVDRAVGEPMYGGVGEPMYGGVGEPMYGGVGESMYGGVGELTRKMQWVGIRHHWQLRMCMLLFAAGQLASMTPEQMQAWRWERELDERNRPLSDEDLNALFPQEGYKILKPPASYQPIRTPARKLTATPTPMGMSGFRFQVEESQVKIVDDLQPSEAGSSLPFLKPEDTQYFSKLLDQVDESTLSTEEQKERRIMTLLLKIKNGTPPMRKSALRQITDKAREFGADSLFNQILPLLMSPTLEDQERHLLVKVIDRILYKLDDLVRPFVHKVCGHAHGSLGACGRVCTC